MEALKPKILNNKQLNDLLLNSLNEAAKSLSQLTNKNMEIYGSKIELLPGEEFANQIGYKLDERYFGSIVKIKGKLDTNIAFIISEKDGLGLYDTITGNTINATKKATEEVISGIGEVNNILGGAFINNLASIIKQEISPDTPINNFDLLGAILEGIILQEEVLDKKVLCADTVIKEKGHEEFRSRFFIMSDKDKLFKLLKEANCVLAET